MTEPRTCSLGPTLLDRKSRRVAQSDHQHKQQKCGFFVRNSYDVTLALALHICHTIPEVSGSAAGIAGRLR